MKKRIIRVLILIFPFIILTSCGRRSHRNYKDESSTNELPVEGNNQETSENGIEDEEEINEEETGDLADDSDDQYSDWIGSGVYKEKIDSQTIKIEMDDEEESYLLTEWAQEDLEDFETEDKISFYYFAEDDNQLVIDEIRAEDFDWEDEYGIEDRYNHHHRQDGRHHHKHHDRRNNRRRHHRRK